MTAVLLAAEILVGVTGYGTSPEMDDIRTNDACNLFVQWEKSGNLLPGGSNDAWIAWAKANGVYLVTADQSRYPWAEEANRWFLRLSLTSSLPEATIRSPGCSVPEMSR